MDINLANAEKGAKIISEWYPNMKVLATRADVSKKAEVWTAVDLAVQKFGRLDIMVRSLFSARGEADWHFGELRCCNSLVSCSGCCNFFGTLTNCCASSDTVSKV